MTRDIIKLIYFLLSNFDRRFGHFIIPPELQSKYKIILKFVI
mgnify:CR=1 FL=1